MCSQQLRINIVFYMEYNMLSLQNNLYLYVLTSNKDNKRAAFRNLTSHIFHFCFVTFKKIVFLFFVSHLCRSSKSPQSRCSSLAFWLGQGTPDPCQRSPLETVALNVGQTTVERGEWNYICVHGTTLTRVTSPVLHNILTWLLNIWVYRCKN